MYVEVDNFKPDFMKEILGSKYQHKLWCSQLPIPSGSYKPHDI